MTETFKGLDKDFRCRGMQYEIGVTYKSEDTPVRCGASGYHSVEMPLDAWTYYGPATSRYAIAEIGGEVARGGERDDSKIASAEITIRAELTSPDFIRRAAVWIVERAKGNTATGYRGHAAATGDSGHAAATGTSGHAAATGDSGHAAATGDSGHAAATGTSGHAAATGYYGHAAATGTSGHAAATGDRGHAAVKGQNAIAVSIGRWGTAKASAGGFIMLVAYDDDGNPVGAFWSAVGHNGVAPDVTYRLTSAGKLECVEEDC